jgi:hypothetical protein
MKIAYLTIDDPANVNAWSGINAHMAAALRNQQAVELFHVGPLRTAQMLISKLKAGALTLRYHKRYLWSRDPRLLRPMHDGRSAFCRHIVISYSVRGPNRSRILEPPSLSCSGRTRHSLRCLIITLGPAGFPLLRVGTVCDATPSPCVALVSPFTV